MLFRSSGMPVEIVGYQGSDEKKVGKNQIENVRSGVIFSNSNNNLNSVGVRPGDSGGPMYYRNNGALELIGVTSAMETNGRGNYHVDLTENSNRQFLQSSGQSTGQSTDMLATIPGTGTTTNPLNPATGTTYNGNLNQDMMSPDPAVRWKAYMQWLDQLFAN